MKENSNRDLQKKLTQETCEREKGVKKNRPLKETYKRDLYMWKGGGKKRRIKETYKRGVWTWKGGKENRLLKETYNRDVYMWNKTSTHCNTLQHISRASQKSPGDPKKTMSCESDACVCVSGGARGGGGLMGFFGRPRMRVAVCCSVLQCVAVWCSELQWVEALAAWKDMLDQMLQCVAVFCSVLQCFAVSCSELRLWMPKKTLSCESDAWNETNTRDIHMYTYT